MSQWTETALGDLPKFPLPSGLIGFIGQLINLYPLLSICSHHPPLRPAAMIQHPKLSRALIFAWVGLFVGLTIATFSTVHRWELVVIAVGNMLLLCFYASVVVSAINDCISKAEGATKNATVEMTPRNQTVEDSRTLEQAERGEGVVVRRSTEVPPSQVSKEHDVRGEGSKDVDVIGFADNPANRDDAGETHGTVPSKTLAEALSKDEPLKAAAGLAFLAVPTLGLLLSGSIVVATEAINGGNMQVEQVVIAFAVFLCLPPLLVAAHLVQRNVPLGKPVKRVKGFNLFMICVVGIGFVVVWFQNWVVASAAGNVVGARPWTGAGLHSWIWFIGGRLPMLVM